MAAPLFDPVRFAAFLGKVGHNKLLGLEYRAHGDDWVELALPWHPELVGEGGGADILASGPILSLFDMTMGMAVWVRAGIFFPSATLDLRVDYLRAARPHQTIIGHAQCYHMTNSVAFLRGEAHDGDPDHPLAHVAASFVISPDRAHPRKHLMEDPG